MAGSAQIGNLQVRLGIDSAEFSAGVKKAQGSLAGLTSSLKAFAAGAVGALSLGTVVSTLRTAATRMDDLGKAAQKIGIPVEELSKLEYAARLADVSLEGLQTSVGRFSKGLAELQSTGKGSAAEALQALNIAAVDAQGKLRPTSDILADLAARFATMQDGAGKTALAMALFGRSGADLIPLLNGGREAIEAAGDELQRFGGVVSEQAAVAAEEFNDNLTRLQVAGESATQQIAQALLPAAVDLTEAFVEFLNTGTPVVDMVESLKDWFAELSPFIEATRKEVEMLTEAYNKLRSLFGNGDAGLPKLQNDMQIWQQMVQTPAGGKSSLPSARRTQPAPIMPNLGGGSGSKDKTLTNYDRDDWKVSAETFASEIDLATEAVNSLADSVFDTLGAALAGLADGSMSLKDAFTDMSRSLISELSSLTTMLLKSGLMQLLGSAGASFAPQTGLAGFGGFYADGGYLGAGKWGVAGETGPEIIHGPAKVTPMAGGSTGGNTQVNIYNQGGGQVEQRKRRGSNGDIVDVYIRSVARDETMKANRKAIPSMFGTAPALAQR
jgi:hypothetical protein